MKSERELLRENLERFRVANSHKTADPAKRQPKFRRLTESEEDSGTLTFIPASEERPVEIPFNPGDRLDYFIVSAEYNEVGLDHGTDIDYLKDFKGAGGEDSVVAVFVNGRCVYDYLEDWPVEDWVTNPEEDCADPQLFYKLSQNPQSSNLRWWLQLTKAVGSRW